MRTLPNTLDIRGHTPVEAISLLKECAENIKKKGCLWLINDYEPTDCYDYLMKCEYYFQTFIISKKEYRVFISCE
ncbi:hypothetical protein EYV94_02775 [Puteibacter caeruleilacunae]|nr:hypothetical protein EYV94_02775 [Puteibacter caeruleilacunae]